MPGYIVIAARTDAAGDPNAAFVVDTARRKAVYFGPEGRDPGDPKREKSTVAKAIRDVLCAGGRLDAPPGPGESPAVVVCAAGASTLLERLAYLCAQPRHGAAPLPAWVLRDARVVLDAAELVPDGWPALADAYAPIDPDAAARFRGLLEAIGSSGRALQQEAAVLAYLLVARGYIDRPVEPISPA